MSRVLELGNNLFRLSVTGDPHLTGRGLIWEENVFRAGLEK